jgi:ArsR family metal-binding transcriptional regulator
MLLKNYTKEIFRPECNPQFQSLHCFLHLDQDISEVLPYLNAVLGGSGYTQDPPSLMLRAHGKLIAVHSRKIAINALKDEEEADKIASWLSKEINRTWDRREKIEPSYSVPPKPQVIEILKLLPKTNCKECGQQTCIVFASLVAEGAYGPEGCRPISEVNKVKLEDYLGQYSFIS